VAFGDDEGPSNGNPAGYIRGLLNEGVAPTRGLDLYREGGGRIQDSRWFDLYKEVNSTYADRPGMLGLDPYSVPGPTDFETWSLGRGNQYATQVQLQVIDRDTGLWFTKQHTYVTDEPHTAADAEADAFALFGDPDTENQYGETVMGALAVTFAQTVPYGSV
jgi:hypothetical protein